MSNQSLLAVSPIDGRYSRQTEVLREYFSEYALIKYRVRIEIEYFIALCQIPLPQLADFDHSKFEALRDIYRNMTPEDAAKVKEIEKVTNHDVKAVEYFIKDRFKEMDILKWGEFVHFGLTSQDINNTSVPLSLKEALEESFMPLLKEGLGLIKGMAADWAEIPMLAKTHGQPASPTRVGKEFNVFVVRLEEQIRQFELLTYPAKFGGATGNMNAHKVAYPGIDWISFGNDFVASLGLKRSFPTTQIEHYDNLASLFDCLRRINTILIDFARDIFGRDSTEANSLELKSVGGTDINKLKKSIKTTLGEGFRVEDRYEQQADVFRIMKIEKFISYLFLSFILLIACFNVIGSLSMLILDKKKDMETLRSLGANDKLISGIFIIEGSMISILGAFTGIVLGVAICLAQERYGIISFGEAAGGLVVDSYPVDIIASDVAVVFVTVIAVGLVAMGVPVNYLTKRLLSANNKE